MTAAPSHPPLDRAAQGTHLVRIILVGRSRLETKLRLDAGIELVRVKSAVAAVGELADAIHVGGASGHVVIVSADADPARVGDKRHPLRAADFLAALRTIDPAVRVLRLEHADGSAPTRAGYDGVIAEDASPEAVRAALRAAPIAAALSATPVAADPPAAPVIHTRVVHTVTNSPPMITTVGSVSAAGGMPQVWTPVSNQTTTPSAAAAATEPAPAASSDEPLVLALLQGRDLIDAATEQLGKRLGTRDVWFEPAELAKDAGSTAYACAVFWRTQRLGTLRSVGTPAAALGPHAHWLAAWLTLRDQHAQLKDAAFTDPLTGAGNRRFFDSFVKSAIDQAKASKRALTLMVFDIDDFKKYNDQFGHAAGDEILRETVKLLRSVIRPSDRVCRIGGDEFVVIFSDAPRADAPNGDPAQVCRTDLAGTPGKVPSDVAAIATRFQRAVNEQRFPKLGDSLPARLSISSGLASYPWDGDTPEALLRRADELSMQSKRAGKNALTFGPGHIS